MPVLTKARYEAFAQNLAAGMRNVDAYLAAGFTPKNRDNASTGAAILLKRRPEIRERMAELKAMHLNKAHEETTKALRARMTPEDIIARLVEIAASSNLPAANKALELLGREFSMFVERKDVTVHETLEDGLKRIKQQAGLTGDPPADDGVRMH